MSEQRSTHRRDSEGEESLDLSSRLERLRPKLQGPSFKLRMLRRGWIGTYFIVMFVPMLVWLLLQWRIYTSERAGALSALIAVPTSLVVIVVLLRVRTRLGMKDDAFTQRRFPRWLQLAAVWLMGYLSLWSAVFLVLVAVAIQQSPGQSNKAYRVAEIQECRLKCSGCRLRVTLQGSPPIAGKVCIDDVRPPPVAGDTLTVSGHYFHDGIYITNVRLAAATERVP